MPIWDIEAIEKWAHTSGIAFAPGCLFQYDGGEAQAPWAGLSRVHPNRTWGPFQARETYESQFASVRLLGFRRYSDDPDPGEWPSIWDQYPAMLGDLEVAAGVFPGGVRVYFNPVEFVDFLTGWFGWDLLGDDPSAAKPPTTRPATQPAEGQLVLRRRE